MEILIERTNMFIRPRESWKLSREATAKLLITQELMQ